MHSKEMKVEMIFVFGLVLILLTKLNQFNEGGDLFLVAPPPIHVSTRLGCFFFFVLPPPVEGDLTFLCHLSCLFVFVFPPSFLFFLTCRFLKV